MARKPRMFVEGVSQHVIQRGNNRSVCFFREADYAFYLQKLQDAAEQYAVAVHAFVLMTNHVHLLVTPSFPHSVPKMMQALGRNYVRYINITYHRTGWEGRYKASLVGGDNYFLTVCRYIEMNPVRANMVNLPGEYSWTSYCHNAMGIRINLISEHDIYYRLGTTRAKRLLAYRELFDVDLPSSVLEEIRLCSAKEGVIGSEKFKLQIERVVGVKVHDRKWGGDRRSEQYLNQDL